MILRSSCVWVVSVAFWGLGVLGFHAVSLANTCTDKDSWTCAFEHPLTAEGECSDPDNTSPHCVKGHLIDRFLKDCGFQVGQLQSAANLCTGIQAAMDSRRCSELRGRSQGACKCAEAQMQSFSSVDFSELGSGFETSCTQFIHKGDCSPQEAHPRIRGEANHFHQLGEKLRKHIETHPEGKHAVQDAHGAHSANTAHASNHSAEHALDHGAGHGEHADHHQGHQAHQAHEAHQGHAGHSGHEGHEHKGHGHSGHDSHSKQGGHDSHSKADQHGSQSHSSGHSKSGHDNHGASKKGSTSHEKNQSGKNQSGKNQSHSSDKFGKRPDTHGSEKTSSKYSHHDSFSGAQGSKEGSPSQAEDHLKDPHAKSSDSGAASQGHSSDPSHSGGHSAAREASHSNTPHEISHNASHDSSHGAGASHGASHGESHDASQASHDSSHDAAPDSSHDVGHDGGAGPSAHDVHSGNSPESHGGGTSGGAAHSSAAKEEPFTGATQFELNVPYLLKLNSKPALLCDRVQWSSSGDAIECIQKNELIHLLPSEVMSLKKGG